MKDDKRIIGFFRYSSNERVSQIFQPYIYLEKGMHTLIKNALRTTYGSGLDLILIEWMCYDKDSEVTIVSRPLSNYSRSEKSIGVKVNVTYENFFSKDELTRRMFIVDSINTALKAVKNKLNSHNGVNIDFEMLIKDFQGIGEKYLKL